MFAFVYFLIFVYVYVFHTNKICRRHPNYNSFYEVTVYKIWVKSAVGEFTLKIVGSIQNVTL